MSDQSTYAQMFTQQQHEQQESPKSLVARILKERRKERELRALNKDRMQRYSDVAEVAKHYTTEGVTADLLRQRQERHLNCSQRSCSTEERGGVARATSLSSSTHGDAAGSSSSTALANGLSEQSASLRRGDSRPITATTASSIASVSKIAVHDAPSTRTQKIQQKSDGKPSAVGTSMIAEEDSDWDEDDEGGGHVCVVKSNVNELLFSGAPQLINAAALVRGRPVVGGGIPLSLRGAAGSSGVSVSDAKRSAHALLPSTAVLPQAPEPSTPSVREGSSNNTSTNKELTPKVDAAVATHVASEGTNRRPARKLSVPAAKALRSIIKRHPIPRKHNRRVHFSEENLKETASQGSHPTLSKDGPPVPFDLNASLQDEMEEMLHEANQRGPSAVAWGADSESFNKEWGLNPSGAPASSDRSESPTKSVKGNSNSNAALCRQSFHTGLSTEEKRLLEAITQVNSKLQSKGFHGEGRPAKPQLRQPSKDSNRVQPPPPRSLGRFDAGQGSACDVVHAGQDQTSQTRGNVSPVPLDVTARISEAPHPIHRLLPPSDSGPVARSGGPGIICGFENIGGMVTRAPIAVTSRTAAVATPVANGCRVVSAPPVLDVPAHITAALPTRKADHQAVTRRDRFGKKMSVIPK